MPRSVILQTDKADVGADITAQEVVELPYTGGEGKNFQSLLYLVPGAGIRPAREANSEAGNPQRAQTLFMNGVSSTSNSTKIDGAVVAYPWLPVNIAYVPPTEAIETVNITTNSFDAEQGAAGGAAVNVQIKSGTNNLHGAVFEYNQNNDMTAVNYFSHTSPLNKNIFNQYGFAIGGPIWIPKIVHGKNKLFFFADYQGTKRRQVRRHHESDAAHGGHADGRLQRHRRHHLRSAHRQRERHRPHAVCRKHRSHQPDRPGIGDVDGSVARLDPADFVHQQLRCLRRDAI